MLTPMRVVSRSGAHERGGGGATTRWNRGTGASVVNGRCIRNAYLVLLSQEQLRRACGGHARRALGVGAAARRRVSTQTCALRIAPTRENSYEWPGGQLEEAAKNDGAYVLCSCAGANEGGREQVGLGGVVRRREKGGRE